MSVTEPVNTLELTVAGRLHLDGSAGVELELTTLPPWLKEGGFVRLTAAGADCACVVTRLHAGPANCAWVDRFKLRALHANDGARVTISPFEPKPARSIAVKAEGSLSDPELLRRLQGEVYHANEETVYYTLSGEPRAVLVTDTSPGGDVLVTADTAISSKKLAEHRTAVGYADIGGLEREIQLLREMVEFPLRSPETFDALGVKPPHGIILHGPPGTGKTLLCRALAGQVGAYFRLVSGPEIYSSTFAGSEEQLRGVFADAQKNAPAVVVIDELDALAPSRDAGVHETERRVVATLLTLMDGLKELRGVVVIGTTNRIDAIDSALLREGRFWPVVRVSPPNVRGRRDILAILAENRMPLADDVNLDLLAEKTHGFVGADLAALCREAAYAALRREFAATGQADFAAAPAPGRQIDVRQEDFEKALSGVAPSAMREFMVEMPSTTWADIGGLDEVKRLLRENVVIGLSKGSELARIGIKPARGILLFGPPGTGKTLLARAIAHEAHANFISVQGPEVKSKWYGETEGRVRHLFAKAREVAPCVVFFDEVDAIAPVRGRSSSGVEDSLVNQILAEMDGVRAADGVVIVGATNRAELIDPALLRPGRFDYHVEVPLPDSAARRAILDIHLSPMPGFAELDLDALTVASDAMSGAEMAEACRRAGWSALRDVGYDVDKVRVRQSHVETALSEVADTSDKVKPKPIGF
jgi:transitional endoplasmic reticulum ATPase